MNWYLAQSYGQIGYRLYNVFTDSVETEGVPSETVTDMIVNNTAFIMNLTYDRRTNKLKPLTSTINNNNPMMCDLVVPVAMVLYKNQNRSKFSKLLFDRFTAEVCQIHKIAGAETDTLYSVRFGKNRDYTDFDAFNVNIDVLNDIETQRRLLFNGFRDQVLKQARRAQLKKCYLGNLALKLGTSIDDIAKKLNQTVDATISNMVAPPSQQVFDTIQKAIIDVDRDNDIAAERECAMHSGSSVSSLSNEQKYYSRMQKHLNLGNHCSAMNRHIQHGGMKW